MGLGQVLLYTIMALAIIQIVILTRMMKFKPVDLKKGRSKPWQVATKINLTVMVLVIIVFAIRVAYFIFLR